jgi:hypothetical protein
MNRRVIGRIWNKSILGVFASQIGELTILRKRARHTGYNSPDCPVCVGLSGERGAQ